MIRKILPIFTLILVASASFLFSPSLSRAQTTLSEEEQLAQMASLLQALQSVVNTLSAASGQSAQGVPPPPPPPPSPAGDGYFGEYWSTPSAGASPAIPTTAPTATRLDTSINFSWGSGSPMSSIPSDHFIVRWTKQQDFSGGDYLFSVNADDGVRLYIDDQLIINQWINQSATTYTAGRTLTAGTHTLRIEYYEAAGSATMQFSFTQTAVAPPVTPAPTATITANPTSITQGQSSTLTWSSTNAASCTASNGWTGTKAVSGTQTVTPAVSTTYSIICTGAGGTTAIQSVTIGVSSVPIPAIPTVTLTANPTSITQGQSSTLTWSSTNTTSCTASNGWSGTKTTGGTQSVSPTSNTTYTLTCTGAGGSANQSVVVGVSAATVYNLVYSTSANRANPIPFNGATVSGGVYVFLTPETGITGDVLFYVDNTAGSGTATKVESNAPYDLAGTNTTNGNAASYNTAQLTNGTHTVTVRVNTNTLVTATFTVANGVSTPTPTITLTASPTSITSGQSSTLTWSSTNTTSCTASNGWSGTKTTGGTQSVSPTSNTTYTLTCTGAGGSANQSVVVGIVDGYFGEYWSTPSAGASPAIPTTAPTATRIDTTIDFNWGTNVPISPVPADHFVARWAKVQNFIAGTYRFTAASDDGIRVYVDDQILINDWTNHGVRTYQNDLALTAGTHSLRIEYYEATGSAVAQFSFAPVGAAADTQAPAISITSPMASATISDTVTVSATASDNVGVVGVQFKLDGGNLGAEDTTTPYSISWDTTAATNGVHAITAVARDAAGNTQTSSSVLVTVNNITAPPPPPAPIPTSDTQAPTISSINTSNITSNSATITWATNESATRQVDYGLAASYGSQTTTQTTLATTHSVSLTNLSANTTYHFRVRSADATGNIGLSLDQTFTTLAAAVADNQAPNSVSNLSAADIRTNSAVLSWNVPADIPSGAPASYDIRYSTSQITSSNFSSRSQASGEPTPSSVGATQSYTLAGLSPGATYYVALVSTDSAGNVSGISNVATFTTSQETSSSTSSNTGTNTSTGSSGSSGGGGGGVTTSITISPKNFVAVGASNQILLTWANPTSSEFVRAKVIRKTGSVPSSSTDGTTIYEGVNQTFIDTNVSAGATYYYAVYAIDRALRTGTPAYAQARLGDVTDTQAVQTIPTNPTAPTAPVAPTAPQVITQNAFTVGLQVGSNNTEVKELQKLLNSLGFTVAENGAGSAGNETTYFGPATANAVARFQGERVPEVPVSERGLVGPTTRAKLNTLVPQKQVIVSAPIQTTSTVSTEGTFSRNLKVGDRGSDVKDLQQALNSLGFTIAASGAGSSGNETEFFGPATADAVARFQEAYRQEVLAPYNLVRGTGFFGASTRTKLNTLVGGEGSGAGDTAALIALLQAQLLVLQAQLTAILSGQTTQVTAPSTATPIPTTPSAPTTSPDNNTQTSTNTSGDTTGGTSSGSSDSVVPPPPPPPPPPAF